MLKLPLVSGYSGRHKKALLSVDAVKSVTANSNKTNLSPSKRKLSRLKNDNRKSMSGDQTNKLFKKNTLIKAIEDKSEDYENAIKDHLGIRSISKDSSRSNLLPSSKPRVTSRVKQPTKTVENSLTDSLAAIEEQEDKITSSLRKLEKKKRISKTKLPTLIPVKSTDREDKEIKLIQDSLNKINLLLNKILNKGPKRNK